MCPGHAFRCATKLQSRNLELTHKCQERRQSTTSYPYHHRGQSGTSVRLPGMFIFSVSYRCSTVSCLHPVTKGLLSYLTKLGSLFGSGLDVWISLRFCPWFSHRHCRPRRRRTVLPSQSTIQIKSTQSYYQNSRSCPDNLKGRCYSVWLRSFSFFLSCFASSFILLSL